MLPSYVTSDHIREFLDYAFREDVGDGDHSTLAAIPESSRDHASLLMKDDGIIAGIEAAAQIIQFYDPRLIMHPLVKDGDPVKYGDVLFTLEGPARSLLTVERIILNCMQRMSGIATKTNHLNSLISHTGAKLLDTRKTTPNFRIMEKWAVFIGGGVNHRFGLYDMIMLKDNHIDYAGGIEKAIAATHEYLSKTGRKLRIEIETRNLEEVAQVLKIGGVDRIMLDNMSISEMTKAVELIGNRMETEASGGITEKTIAAVAETGVNFISVGALTHSVRSLDMSLKATESIEK
ncbi:carboxylating nicotinate-nucleotide diphosphorylase [Fulvivirga sedimenti]|jgi:nicotinate-nucleotide pyrophosphorylase (carboxylating)|uniref:Probable nicotinate-nucleotide pyrophosphorylase [carboxylating] n=1 Tax=Fulvivirga sedimenti TaxID=2879465 RepID=A0A9X1HNS3_9BACT|nr:carboxylating nicotinate-nucleotide diphosphorylase [Fulvivirga sedimenti]MCA6074410.1 carboxylating nicotinate-nucleotide diphosphorylase [Fulvivirga sedimenti]